MPPHPLTNFAMQKYYQNKPKFNSVCSRNILPKIKDGLYVINLGPHACPHACQSMSSRVTSSSASKNST